MRVALSVFLFAISATVADLPRYWTVHIDFPADRATFERLDRQFTETIHDFYASNHVDQPLAMRFATSDGHYYGLRSRGTLADIEKPSALGPELSKQLQAKTAPISEETHKTLREHHNEIWQIERDSTTTAEIRPRKYALLRTDVVSPPKHSAYEAAMKVLIGELSGVDVIGFFSIYGDGSYRYLFLSDSPIKVRPLKGLAQTHDATVHF